MARRLLAAWCVAASLAVLVGSVDGAKDPWTIATLQAQFTPRTCASAITFGNHAVFAGGAGPKGELLNEVWRSTKDGSVSRRVAGTLEPALMHVSAGDWGPVLQGSKQSRDAPWAPRSGHQFVAVGATTAWLMGGYAGGVTFLNDVWITNDLSHWHNYTAQWSRRTGHMAVDFSGKVYVMAGAVGSTYNNEVWASVDGITWTQEPTPPWSARTEARAVTYDGSVFIAGGRGVGSVGTSVASSLFGRFSSASVTNGYLNDVWKSASPTTAGSWVKVTASAGWTARSSFGMLPFGGMLWVVGGLYRKTENTATTYGDVWKSTDGATWVGATTDAVFVNRSAFGLVEVEAGMVVFGGLYEETQDPSVEKRYLDDVWASTPALFCEAHGMVCSRHGNCPNKTCECSFGFAGSQCEVPVCDPKACQHGSCKPGAGVFSQYPLKTATAAAPTRTQPPAISKPLFGSARALRPTTATISPSHCACDPFWNGYNCSEAVCRPGCLQGTCIDQPDACNCYNGYFGELCDQHSELHALGVWVKQRAQKLYMTVSIAAFAMVLVSSVYTNYWKRRQAAVLKARARSTGRRVRFQDTS